MKFWVLFLGLIGLAVSDPEVESWESGQWQGDIVLNQRQKQILAGNARTSNTGLLELSLRWPKLSGFVWVPYKFDPGQFSEADKMLVRNDLRTIEKKTCIRFQSRTNQTNYVRIFNGVGCWSYLGMQGGEQLVSFQNPGCVWPGTVAHEFIHALGYTHMQNHIDRDQFVTINFENINPANAHNFNKVDANKYGNFETPYDYYSVMHYRRKAFSTNGNDTIVPINSSFIDIIGQRQISPGDVARLNNMYTC